MIRNLTSNQLALFNTMMQTTYATLPFICFSTLITIKCENAESVQYIDDVQNPEMNTPSLADERKLFRELLTKYEKLEAKYDPINGGTVHPDDIEDLRRFYASKREDLKKVNTSELRPEDRCVYLMFTQYLKRIFTGENTPPKLSGDKKCPYLKTVSFLKKFVCANEKVYPDDNDRKKCPWIRTTNFISENKNLAIGALVFFIFLTC